MYQFYYADTNKQYDKGVCSEDVRDYFNIKAVRPAMWEEHCLECSAPACYNNCLHYQKRKDGRCKRFDNGFLLFDDPKACCGHGVHIKFRKWANMMTIVFPSFQTKEKYERMIQKNSTLGKYLKRIAEGRLPVKVRWETIRIAEFLRRRNLRKLPDNGEIPDAFIFHGFSYCQETYQLVIEVYDNSTSVFRTSLLIEPGENLHILPQKLLSTECWRLNNLVKIYPENDIEAELDILWCDFVKGEPIVAQQPASKVKCLVWDLDNTLWDGTLIETDNPETLQLKPGVLETIKSLDERGIVQSIASKNDFDAAWTVVKHLKLDEYFLYPQIHWNAKSGSLEVIAKSLNIGIDSLALIDDSAFERGQVHSVWPQIRTYDIEELPELLDKPEFTMLVTSESKNRRKMYRAEEYRNELKAHTNDDTVTFLKKCNLQVILFEPKEEQELLRCYELVVRTNQLNMSGKKYSAEEFGTVLKRSQHKNFAFSCRDDFGEYGIVGFGQYHIEKDTIIFSEFAMSCRVAGKYVESALFCELLSMEKCSRGYFEIVKTKKNQLLRNTLEGIGFVVEQKNDQTISYTFNSQLLNCDIVNVVIQN